MHDGRDDFCVVVVRFKLRVRIDLDKTNDLARITVLIESRV